METAKLTHYRQEILANIRFLFDSIGVPRHDGAFLLLN